MNYPVKHTISLSILLFLLWLGLSGHFNLLMLSLGLASTATVVYLAHRMGTFDHEVYPTHMTTLLLRFCIYLAREVFVANIDVLKRIFKPGKNISPRLFELPVTQKTALTRVIYANAITLTPGTVTVNLTNTTLTVHSISAEGETELRSGQMADAVPEEVAES